MEIMQEEEGIRVSMRCYWCHELITLMLPGGMMSYRIECTQCHRHLLIIRWDVSRPEVPRQ